MSDTPAARWTRHSGARSAASLRARYDDEVTELVELVLVQPAARRAVDEVFDAAQARFELGVRPEHVRSWLLGLARELALTMVRERPELTVRPAEGLELLPFERTLLHLHRRCGIGVDELAEALSDQPDRLAVRLAQLDRRFLDFLAVRVLVVDNDSHCAAFNAIVAANRDRLEVGSFARGHAHSCPDCRELIRSRAETTDMLGRPTPIAVRAIPVFDRPSRPRPRHLPVRALAVVAVAAGIVATAAFAIGPRSFSTTPAAPQAGPADVAPPSPVTGLTVTTRRSVFAKPGMTVTWEEATDDVGVVGYELYVDGSLKGQTADTSFVITGLDCGHSVSVGVDAYDAAGNRSSMASVPASTGRCRREPPAPGAPPQPPPPTSVSGNYYVSLSGSDSSPGSSSAPFRTLQKAADVVSPGDVVVVRDGVYAGPTRSGGCGDQPIVCLTRGGTSSATVVFKAEHKWGAVLDGFGNEPVCAGIAFGSRASYVRVEGFEIRNIACNGSASAVESFVGAHDIAIVGNNIHDIGHICTNTSNGQVAIYGRSSNVLIEGNWIHVVGRFAPAESGCNPSNDYYQNHDHGIYWDGTPTGLTIRNNVFETIKNGWAIQLWNGTISDVQIVHNTFVDGNDYREGSFIVLWSGTHTNYTIRNNIFDHPLQAAIATTSRAIFQNVVFDNNLVTSGTVTDIRTPPGISVGPNNLFDVTPTYVGKRDFHLAAGSAGLDAGADLGVTTDFDGNPRPVGRPDIGAYERQRP